MITATRYQSIQFLGKRHIMKSCNKIMIACLTFYCSFINCDEKNITTAITSIQSDEDVCIIALNQGIVDVIATLDTPPKVIMGDKIFDVTNKTTVIPNA